jgi:hypothetical protein
MNEELNQVALEGQDDPTGFEQDIVSDDLTPDEAAASLSFANTLAEDSMPQAPESPEMAQGEAEGEEMTETKGQEKEADIEALVDAKVEEKMSELREELTSALAEEETSEEDGQEED